MHLTTAPRLETERLILRHYRLSDYPELVACWQDPEMVRYIGNGEPQSAEMTWARILRYVGHWQLMGYGYWACIEKCSGALVGSIGPQQAQRNITPALTLPEAGWSIRPFAQGKGYARESLTAILAWADGALESDLCCIIDDVNLKSIRLAEDNGFVYQAPGLYHGKSLKVFTRTR